jgi:hypothetical protein
MPIYLFCQTRQSWRNWAIERTDGIPLFVEEMTKAVLEAESEGHPVGRSILGSRGACELARLADGAARFSPCGHIKVMREVGAMIDRVIGNKLLPPNIRQDIIERTDGIPLFVEEMTKAVLEAESEGHPAGRSILGSKGCLRVCTPR